MEVVLQKLRVTSGEFQEIRQGHLDQRKRTINVLTMIFLVIEMFRWMTFTYLDPNNHWSIVVGAPLIYEGRSGKVMYIIVIMLILCALICRMAIFAKEKTGELDFMFDPIDYIEEQERRKNRMSDKMKDDLLDIFVKNTQKFFKTAKKQSMSRFLLSNSYCCYYVVVSISKYGISVGKGIPFAYTCISYMICSWYYISGFAFTSCLWKMATSYLVMRIRAIIMNMENLIIEVQEHRKSAKKSTRNITRKLNVLLDELGNIVTQVNKFDSCLKWFLFATLVAMTPTSCFLISSYLYIDYTDREAMKWIVFLLFFLIVFQGVDPMFRTSRIYSSSRKLVPVLNKLYATSTGIMSVRDKQKLLVALEIIGCNMTPVSLNDCFGIPFTPMAFMEVSTTIVRCLFCRF